MIATEVVPGFYRVSLGIVNAYLLVARDELTVIDAGPPGAHRRILKAADELGHPPEAIRGIVITHLHLDHTGGLNGLRGRTGAPVHAHPLDAREIRRGVSIRQVGAGGTWLGRLLGFANRYLPLPSAEPSDVDVEVVEGDRIGTDGCLQVMHAPGHSAGQISLLWEAHGGVLICGDAASKRFGLRHPPFYEDAAAGRSTLRRLAALEFRVAVFGHGDPIASGAAARFRDRFGTRAPGESRPWSL